MSKRNKKPILLVVWLVLLGGLLFAISHLGNGLGGAPDQSDGSKSAPTDPPPPPAALLAKRWPEIVAHAAAPPRGPQDAPYTMAEFGDFQCPQCGKVRPKIEALLAKYPQQVNLIFVHRPFPRIHQWALPAAQASEIAAARGKFWPMYDALYSHQDDLEPGFYGDYAAQVGIDKGAFTKAFDAHQGAQAVTASSAFSDSLGIQETPTLLVRDNARGTVTAYVGLTGTLQKLGKAGTPGIKDLVASPPWAASARAAAKP